MTQEEKLAMIAKTIEADNLTPGTELSGLDVWDSLGRLSIAIMLDREFKKSVAAEKFLAFKTVKDIMDEME
jgi:acyl carrier protein